MTSRRSNSFRPYCCCSYDDCLRRDKQVGPFHSIKPRFWLDEQVQYRREIRAARWPEEKSPNDGWMITCSTRWPLLLMLLLRLSVEDSVILNKPITSTWKSLIGFKLIIVWYLFWKYTKEILLRWLRFCWLCDLLGQTLEDISETPQSSSATKTTSSIIICMTVWTL